MVSRLWFTGCALCHPFCRLPRITRRCRAYGSVFCTLCRAACRSRFAHCLLPPRGSAGVTSLVCRITCCYCALPGFLRLPGFSARFMVRACCSSQHCLPASCRLPLCVHSRRSAPPAWFLDSGSPHYLPLPVFLTALFTAIPNLSPLLPARITGLTLHCTCGLHILWFCHLVYHYVSPRTTSAHSTPAGFSNAAAHATAPPAVYAPRTCLYLAGCIPYALLTASAPGLVYFKPQVCSCTLRFLLPPPACILIALSHTFRGFYTLLTLPYPAAFAAPLFCASTAAHTLCAPGSTTPGYCLALWLTLVIPPRFLPLRSLPRVLRLPLHAAAANGFTAVAFHVPNVSPRTCCRRIPYPQRGLPHNARTPPVSVTTDRHLLHAARSAYRRGLPAARFRLPCVRRLDLCLPAGLHLRLRSCLLRYLLPFLLPAALYSLPHR